MMETSFTDPPPHGGLKAEYATEIMLYRRNYYMYMYKMEFPYYGISVVEVIHLWELF